MGLLSKRKNTVEAEAEREAALTSAVAAAVAETAGEALTDSEDTTPLETLEGGNVLIETAARLSAILTEADVQRRVDLYNQELRGEDDYIRELLKGKGAPGELALNLQKSMERAHAIAKQRDDLAGAFKFFQQVQQSAEAYKQLANGTVALCEARLRAAMIYRQIALEEAEARFQLDTHSRALHRQVFSLRKDPQTPEADLEVMSRAIEEVKSTVMPILRDAGTPQMI